MKGRLGGNMKLSKNIMEFLSTLIPANLKLASVVEFANCKNGCGMFDCEGGCSGDCEGSCDSSCPGNCDGTCSGEVW